MVERLIRLIWTALSAAGAVYALMNWRDAARDYKLVKTLPDYHPDGPRGIAGRAGIRREQLRALAQSCFLVAGALTIVAPPPPPPPHKGRGLTIVCLVLAQLSIVLNDVMDRSDRRRAIEAPPYRRRKTG